ncbi:hypothetical protein ACCO45_005110 [Purpureocillium lilacinum]|uniref:Uncharacterized protein n=1 Tax=Purpureocillium lilacinum TaxID=33203 RepID=A0ACC4DXJ8_PURLI
MHLGDSLVAVVVVSVFQQLADLLGRAQHLGANKRRATSSRRGRWMEQGEGNGEGALVWDWTGLDSQDFGAAAGCAFAHFGVAHVASKVVPVRLEGMVWYVEVIKPVVMLFTPMLILTLAAPKPRWPTTYMSWSSTQGLSPKLPMSTNPVVTYARPQQRPRPAFVLPG